MGIRVLDGYDHWAIRGICKICVALGWDGLLDVRSGMAGQDR